MDKVECDICNDAKSFNKESGNSAFDCVCTYDKKDLIHVEFMNGSCDGYEMSDEQAEKWDKFLMKK